MKTRIISYYSVFLGISIVAMWILILSSQEIAEGPAEFSFHLCAEFLMALACMAGGVMFLKNYRFGQGVLTAGHGMVVYSVLNAAGYYAERDGTGFAVMFMVLLLFSAVTLIFLAGNKELTSKENRS
jgi:phosphotransferase system  glucose/maltose/N-acetylglucosamine-specific IIC component